MLGTRWCYLVARSPVLPQGPGQRCPALGLLSQHAHRLQRRVVWQPSRSLASSSSHGTRPPFSSELALRLLRLAKPEYPLIAGAVCSVGFTSAITLYFPTAIGGMIDNAVVHGSEDEPLDSGEPEKHPNNSMKSEALLLAGMFLVGGAVTFARVSALTIAAERVVARVRRKLFTSLISQEMVFYDTQKTGDLVSRMSSDCVVMSRSTTDVLSQGARCLAEGMGAASLIFYLSPQLAGMTMCIMPPLGIGAVYYGRKLRTLSKDLQKKYGEVTQHADERISHIRTVRVFNQEEKERRLFGDRVHETFLIARQSGILSAAFVGSVSTGFNMALLAVVYQGGQLVQAGALSVGDLTSFMMYSIYVGFAFSGLSGVFGDAMKGIGASERVFEILDGVPEKPVFRVGEPGNQPGGSIVGHVVFDDVHFRYPTRSEAPLLRGLKLELLPGTITAVVGSSGSGKSTTAALLARFYDPDGGRVLVDGQDIREVDPSWLRGQMAMVSQEPALFATTLRDNICYGRPDASEHDMMAAARLANVDDFVASLPDGYDTYVGERGVALSGGQKQRVAIARAVLMNPAILVLDEATSQLDMYNERLVQEALERLMEGRTTLMITHRLESTRSADQIVVLNDGIAAEAGSFDELKEKDGLFHHLLLQQNPRSTQT